MMEDNSKKSKKRFEINFDFSDDSEEEFQPDKVINKIGIKGKRKSHHNDEQNNSIIMSSDYLGQQFHLHSFLSEDFGPPVMDSTHLITNSKESPHSVLGDVTNEARKTKLKVIDSKDVDFKDIKNRNHFGEKMKQKEKIEEKENVSSSENTNDKDSSFSGSKTSLDHFLTASEDQLQQSTEVEESTSLSNCPSSSQDLSSYYVQDVSIQTSLRNNEMSNLSSATVPNRDDAYGSSSKNHENPISCPLPKSVSSTNTSPSKQTLTLIAVSSIENGLHTNHKDLYNFADCSSARDSDSPIAILAADSDIENCSVDDEFHSKCDDVVADSDNNQENESDSIKADLTSSISKSSPGTGNPQHKASEKFNKKDFCATPLTEPDKNDRSQSDSCHSFQTEQRSKRKCNTDFATSGGVDLACPADVDALTSSISGLSVSSHQRKSSSQQRKFSSSSSSDDDDNFENFLAKLKEDKEVKTVAAEKSPSSSINDFIVDSDELSYSEASENNDDESTDQVLFHIKTNNKLDRQRHESRHFEKTYFYQTSSCTDSEHDSDSNFIEDHTGYQTKNKISDQVPGNKSSTRVGKSSSKKALLNLKECFVKSPVSPSKDVDDSIRDQDESEESHTSSSVEKGKRRTGTPRTKSRLLNRWQPGSLGYDSDDDFSADLKTPKKFATPLTLPFRTPKQTPKSGASFQTPVGQRGQEVHPWTASKAPEGSDSSQGRDSNSLFLKSLSSDYSYHKRHPEAVKYFKNFARQKEELTTKLFHVFNETIFESRIPSSLILEWNPRYLKTAGSFSYKGTFPNYTSKITLSTKVCDSPERVRDTMIHEMCHAAVKLINGVNESHGRVWKSWARKVMVIFPFLPVVARCHDYIIQTKYTYQCVNCRYRVGRHSKSLDTERKVCGHCKGEFQVFLTSELNSSDSSTPVTPRTPRTPNKFALFVKECYSEVKKKNTNFKHGDIMKELSKEFAEKNKI